MGEQLEGQIELLDYLRSLNKEKLDILEYIPVGHENAVSRKELADRVGIGDRAVRDLIHLKRREKPILNVQDGKGYFQPDLNNPEEVMLLAAYVRQEESRIKSAEWSLRSARRALREHEVQVYDTREIG